MDGDIVERLKKIADAYGAKITLSEAKDGSYIDCVIESGPVDLYIGVTRGQNNKYYAHDITSSGLPREFYADWFQNGFTEQKRTHEIAMTTDRILSKNVNFHQKPGWFNKERGYIVLPVDGIERKLHQKRNSFNLPVIRGK